MLSMIILLATYMLPQRIMVNRGQAPSRADAMPALVFVFILVPMFVFVFTPVAVVAVWKRFFIAGLSECIFVSESMFLYPCQPRPPAFQQAPRLSTTFR
jgi:hypothetical protein